MEALKISQTVMDPYSARILLGTWERPASALDLSRRFGIPIAACYRRIRQLENLGLVYCETALPSRNGKGLQLFRSSLRSVRVSLEEGRLKASFVIDGGAEARSAEQVVDLTDARPGA